MNKGTTTKGVGTMKTETVKSSNIRCGDTVIINGSATTIGRNNLKIGFMGTVICGQNKKEFERVLFPRWRKDKLIGHFAQV